MSGKQQTLLSWLSTNRSGGEKTRDDARIGEDDRTNENPLAPLPPLPDSTTTAPTLSDVLVEQGEKEEEDELTLGELLFTSSPASSLVDDDMERSKFATRLPLDATRTRLSSTCTSRSPVRLVWSASALTPPAATQTETAGGFSPASPAASSSLAPLLRGDALKCSGPQPQPQRLQQHHQTRLDFGQAEMVGLVRCSTCGMLYSDTDDGDLEAHRQHCRWHQKASKLRDPLVRERPTDDSRTPADLIDAIQKAAHHGGPSSHSPSARIRRNAQKIDGIKDDRKRLRERNLCAVELAGALLAMVECGGVSEDDGVAFSVVEADGPEPQTFLSLPRLESQQQQQQQLLVVVTAYVESPADWWASAASKERGDDFSFLELVDAVGFLEALVLNDATQSAPVRVCFAVEVDRTAWKLRYKTGARCDPSSPRLTGTLLAALLTRVRRRRGGGCEAPAAATSGAHEDENTLDVDCVWTAADDPSMTERNGDSDRNRAARLFFASAAERHHEKEARAAAARQRVLRSAAACVSVCASGRALNVAYRRGVVEKLRELLQRVGGSDGSSAAATTPLQRFPFAEPMRVYD